MISEKDAQRVAEDFLQESRTPGEPELAIDWAEVKVREGILIAPYNSSDFLRSRDPGEQLLDCWPILVDLSTGQARFGDLSERSFWKDA
ncbi:YrhB domain-containing protein [Streptomyces sp. MBT58]|uniref:YrhB domain-containing protein n=1 Tax=Streptomyces sp. MBT58 TaxID=1488389 RepID=UPI00191429F6|nr:YrhB domain-containing protein [Streptomyces sp. MBT58]